LPKFLLDESKRRITSENEVMEIARTWFYQKSKRFASIKNLKFLYINSSFFLETSL